MNKNKSMFIDIQQLEKNEEIFEYAAKRLPGVLQLSYDEKMQMFSILERTFGKEVSDDEFVQLAELVLKYCGVYFENNAQISISRENESGYFPMFGGSIQISRRPVEQLKMNPDSFGLNEFVSHVFHEQSHHIASRLEKAIYNDSKILMTDDAIGIIKKFGYRRYYHNKGDDIPYLNETLSRITQVETKKYRDRENPKILNEIRGFVFDKKNLKRLKDYLTLSDKNGGDGAKYTIYSLKNNRKNEESFVYILNYLITQNSELEKRGIECAYKMSDYFQVLKDLISKYVGKNELLDKLFYSKHYINNGAYYSDKNEEMARVFEVKKTKQFFEQLLKDKDLPYNVRNLVMDIFKSNQKYNQQEEYGTGFYKDYYRYIQYLKNDFFDMYNSVKPEDKLDAVRENSERIADMNSLEDNYKFVLEILKNSTLAVQNIAVDTVAECILEDPKNKEKCRIFTHKYLKSFKDLYIDSLTNPKKEYLDIPSGLKELFIASNTNKENYILLEGLFKKGYNPDFNLIFQNLNNNDPEQKEGAKQIENIKNIVKSKSVMLYYLDDILSRMSEYYSFHEKVDLVQEYIESDKAKCLFDTLANLKFDSDNDKKLTEYVKSYLTEKISEIEERVKDINKRCSNDKVFLRAVRHSAFLESNISYHGKDEDFKEICNKLYNLYHDYGALCKEDLDNAPSWIESYKEARDYWEMNNLERLYDEFKRIYGEEYANLEFADAIKMRKERSSRGKGDITHRELK